MDAFFQSMKQILNQLAQKQIISMEDCFLILDGDILTDKRNGPSLSKLDENIFKRVAS